MSGNEEQKAFVGVHFNVTQEKIKTFLQQFAPMYKGYILDQTPRQLYSSEYNIRIYYEDHSSMIVTCYSPAMIQERIQNIFNINQAVKFTNRSPVVEEHRFALQKVGEEDNTTYYTAVLYFEFTRA